MRKFAGTLFAVLGFTVKLILLFALIIVSADLVNRYLDDRRTKAIDAEET